MSNWSVRFLAVCVTLAGCTQGKQADLLLKNGKVWTGVAGDEFKTWVAIKDGRILETGGSLPFDGEAANTIDLKGRLALPGFNDSHVHFASAGHLLLNISLLDVSDATGFIARVKETASRLPSGSWITRGDWGAYEAWAMGSDGTRRTKSGFIPHRAFIDSISTDHPVLVTRYDRKQGLANALALQHLGLESESGILQGSDLTWALEHIPEKSFEQLLAETRRGLEECRKWGVTTVQDMSPPGQLAVYQKLLESGELTCRINFSPSRLVEYQDMIEKGWVISRDRQPSGAEWLSYGTLKTHIDGIMGARSARFYEPYSDNDVENRFWTGSWREFSQDMPSFKQMITRADAAGIQMRIHAIGDLANAIVFDILDTLDQANGQRDRRFRLVHAQVLRLADFSRFQGRGVVAEVQPYHVTDDMRWMEERIGADRCAGAYAFRTLLENGCTLSFGSDWPGTNASYYPINPLLGLYAAVTRQTLQGEPEEGWFPDQRLSIEESLHAYTWGSAFGAFEESRKGTLEDGKMADVVVLDTDLFSTSPEEWLKATVLLTIVDGKVVHRLTD